MRAATMPGIQQIYCHRTFSCERGRERGVIARTPPSLPREWSSCHWCQTSFSSSSAAPSRPRSCPDLDLAQWRSGGGSNCNRIDTFSQLTFQASQDPKTPPGAITRQSAGFTSKSSHARAILSTRSASRWANRERRGVESTGCDVDVECDRSAPAEGRRRAPIVAVWPVDGAGPTASHC